MTRILSVESSCDETSVAIIENGQKILSNIIALIFGIAMLCVSIKL